MTKTTVMRTTTDQRTTTDSDLLVEEYEQWLVMWTELTLISSGGFSPRGIQQPMTDEQKDAARTIPDVLDRLQESWAMLPESVRPSHFTFPVLQSA